MGIQMREEKFTSIKYACRYIYANFGTFFSATWYICRRHSMCTAYYGRGSVILAYHTKAHGTKMCVLTKPWHASIATSTSLRYETLQKSFVTECLDAAE